MNPFTYKAHPLLSDLIGLVMQTSHQPMQDIEHVLTVLLWITPIYGIALRYAAYKIDEAQLSFPKALGLGLPSTLAYTPLMLTIMNDVVHHAFVFQERWFLLFAIIVASQMMSALYAFTIRSPKERGPVGIESGLGISMLLLLTSIPLSLALLGIDSLIPIF